MGEGDARLWPAAIAAITGSIIVGFMPILALRIYAAGMSAPSMLFWRYVLALCPLALAIPLSGLNLGRAFRAGAWRITLVGATLGAGQTLCFWESLRTLESSIAVLLFYTYPAITLLLDRLIYKRPISPAAVVCIGVILFGAGLITGPGLRGGTIDPTGVLWALPSPLIYSLYLTANATLLRRHAPLAGGLFLYVGMAASFATLGLFAGLDVPTTPELWLLLLIVGFGPGALTIILFSYSVPRLGPSSYAIIANVELVTVVAVGILVLGEPLTAGRAFGGALIITGILAYGLSRGGGIQASAPAMTGTPREEPASPGTGG